MDFDHQTPSSILCCMCGITIPFNPASMCVNCIRNQVDITEGIPKQLNVQWCKGCGRYFQPPNAWIVAELESRQLLAICIKRIKGLNKVKLIDAGFVWTEPHSKRLKVKLTIQKEVLNATILQQSFVIEYVVQNLFCSECQRAEAKLTWRAAVQVRQKVEHKRTFFWLEQLILKHNANAHCSNIKEMPDGLDFFFGVKGHSAKFIDFISQFVPIRSKTAKELISQDFSSNTYNYKFTISVEIAPVCKDDLLCLPVNVARSCGNISPLVICHKLADSIHFLDPLTLHTEYISAPIYWRTPFRSIAGRSQLTRFVVLDVINSNVNNGKYNLAEVHIARERDLGSNDTQFVTLTHLGNLLKPGDLALGYDLTTISFPEGAMKSFRGDAPDVILVRKAYVQRRRRKWKLKSLGIAALENQRKSDIEKAAREKSEFLQDLEEDPELWKQVDLYRDDDVSSVSSEMTDDEQFPGPRLEDLISSVNKMNIDDMDTGE